MKILNQNFIQIVKILNDLKYHDVDLISKHLNITRTSVWKEIKKLKKYNVSINSIDDKCYKLYQPLILLNIEQIKFLLRYKNLRYKNIDLDILEKTKSTNDYLKQFLCQKQKIKICLAEMQTQGKGRMQRKWYSPFGENIYCSILYTFDKNISELSGLSLIVALAICQAINTTLQLPANQLQIKWPNDIINNDCKIAGILIELQAESHNSCQVIIGIGINVNMQHIIDFDLLAQNWSSLFMINNKYQDRNILCANLIDYLLDYLELFSYEGLKVFMDEWQNKDYLLGKNISLFSGDKKSHGICLGINNQANLLLQTAKNKILNFIAGDTTLRK